MKQKRLVVNLTERVRMRYSGGMKKKTRKIYIVRHGESYFNRSKRFTGWIDSRLTLKGKAQARKVAKDLKEADFEMAYVSSLSRAKDTLKFILKYHPEVKVIEDDRIIERNYGELSGKHHSSYVKKRPKLFWVYRRSYDVPPPGGESIKQVEDRVMPFLDEVMKKIKKEKINVLIVAHGNSMRPMRRHLENLSVEKMMKLENAWDKAYVYEVEV